ncbi:uncharacterized protein BJ171DRAFT_238027 [Polychytrium aggregatum]|uniref:uncharacterized protein n=1 Tax=Polychytrium aggregatum TaxID=110093 RepID=UPI0022FE1F6F|nr:uncharacterized protein BJ171DRAFT_238027 [Polychytrium aggregatum]KAI9208309.1 hypothetical protein BJ171DRAFT_238027 [Polychytrium aggregatum]
MSASRLNRLRSFGLNIPGDPDPGTFSEDPSDDSMSPFTSRLSISSLRDEIRAGPSRSPASRQRLATQPNMASPSIPTQFDYLIQCIICFEALADPVMCPSCGKAGCESCMQKWLQRGRSQCPHCRKALTASSLIPCRFIRDFVQELQVYVAKSQEQSAGTCRIHSQPFQYYCIDCLDTLCADCAIFGSGHKGHRFEKLETVFQSQKQLIDNKRHELEARLDGFSELLSSADEKVASVHAVKREILGQYQTVLNDAIMRLERAAAQQIEMISDYKRDVLSESELIKTTLEKVREHVEQTTQAEVIINSAKIIELMDKQHRIRPAEFRPLHVESLQNEFVPDYIGSTFRIHNFSTARASSDPLYSPPFLAAGLLWRLKVYCGGNGQSSGNFMSVFIELVKGTSKTATYQYRIELIKLVPTITGHNFTREFSSQFDVGECWGYNRFYRLETLEQRGYRDPVEDCIEFKYYIRAPTYQQQSHDLLRFCVGLEQERYPPPPQHAQTSVPVLNTSPEAHPVVNGDVSGLFPINHQAQTVGPHPQQGSEAVETNLPSAVTVASGAVTNEPVQRRANLQDPQGA